MPLVLASLESGLAQRWLVPDGGSFPESHLVSGDRFAGEVAQWFSNAQSLGIPCATAMARKLQLTASAAAAFQAKEAQAVGTALALAVAGYIAGQSFGPGAATFPLALMAAASAIAAVMSDMQMSLDDRAQQIASALTLLAQSTIVAFPNPPFAAPIL